MVTWHVMPRLLVKPEEIGTACGMVGSDLVVELY